MWHVWHKCDMCGINVTSVTIMTILWQLWHECDKGNIIMWYHVWCVCDITKLMAWYYEWRCDVTHFIVVTSLTRKYIDDEENQKVLILFSTQYGLEGGEVWDDEKTIFFVNKKWKVLTSNVDWSNSTTKQLPWLNNYTTTDIKHKQTSERFPPHYREASQSADTS